MYVAHPHRSSTGQPNKRVAMVLVAGATVAAGALTAPAATAGPDADLGPTVVHTNEAPTGYEVTFRYEAPPGVESVQIYGEWWFSQPENVTCEGEGCGGDARSGAEWQPGDILATPWRTMPMEQGADGVWTFTTPLPSGTFRYAFTHDCTSETASGCTLHPDPANPLEVLPHADARGALLSRVYVPSSQRFPTYDNEYQAPVGFPKAGTLEERRYDSPLSTNPPGEHDVVVYLPHGYDPDRSKPYPTLYLSHGGSGNATDWTMEGVAHHILENAIQDRAAQPMVIVSTDFYGLPDGTQGYANELRDNVIPFVEESYNVSTRADDRAFGGLSAGGSRAATILYDNTDLVEYHAVWSSTSASTTPTRDQIERMKTISGGIHMGVGLQDYGGTNENSLLRAANLRAAGIEVTEYNIDGVHVWDVWRQLLNHYIRNLAFRSTTTDLDVETAQAGTSDRVRLTATATVDTVTTSVQSPSGKVEFYAGDAYLGSAPVRNGVASLKKTTGDDAEGPIVAHYQGDNLFNESESTPVDAS